MSLKTQYPADFESIWNEYPKWPKGRSVKQLAFRKFQQKKKEMNWSDADVYELKLEIRKQRDQRATWQPGNQYGPQAIQAWLHQHGWEQEYETKDEVRKDRKRTGTPREHTDPWQIRGITQGEYEAEQDWLARKSMNMPQRYDTAIEAMAAAKLRGMTDGERH